MLFALLIATQDPAYYRPTGPTIVAEPVALYLAAADRDRDGRTTLAELRQSLVETTSADPRWGDGIGYLAYSDWAGRWLGDRNGLPTPLEVDRNGDSRVTVEEMSQRMEAIFTRLDVDKDGALSRAELLSVRRSAFDDRPDRKRDRDRDRPAPPSR